MPISPEYNEMLKIKYSVTGYVWLSDTRMFFRTDLGDQIHIDNGIAWVKGVDGIEYPACAGNSTCAAFKASGVDLDELQNRADAALLDEHRRLGDTAEYTIRQIRRRRLHKDCDGTAGCGLAKEDDDHRRLVEEGDHRPSGRGPPQAPALCAESAPRRRRRRRRRRPRRCRRRRRRRRRRPRRRPPSALPSPRFLDWW